MLTTLRIKNLALVTDLTVEFQAGYNVITGETGAGKSILMGALKLVLGGRADRTLIRSECDSCSVEAVFEIGALQKRIDLFLEENGMDHCENGQLILKRTVSNSGTNRQFVNGSPTTLQTLATLGEWLVDFHGPHDHQSLLHSSKQLAILDAFGALGKLRDTFVEILLRREALEARKAALIVDEQTYAQQLDLLRHQVHEISAARLRAGEEAELEQEYQRASNASKLLDLSQVALGLLSENEHSMMNCGGALGRTLQELQRFDASASCLLSLHSQATEAMRELQSELSHYVDKIDVNPARLQELEERVNLLHNLKRKYGNSLAAVIEFGRAAEEKLRSLEHREEELTRLSGEILKVSAELRRAGQELSAARKKVIPRLCRAVSKQLTELGFKQSQFDIALSTTQEAGGAAPEHEARQARLKARVSSAGFDTVEFLFSPNPGEPARPLRAIASSGEMARVMLALKTVLAAEDEVPVLIFDEVDANVGGETATAVGQKMLQIGRQRQVLCITHLPAVAACAVAQLVVSKQVKGGRTTSEISLLKGYERINELARMLGGQSEAARKHARALLEAQGHLE